MLPALCRNRSLSAPLSRPASLDDAMATPAPPLAHQTPLDALPGLDDGRLAGAVHGGVAAAVLAVLAAPWPSLGVRVLLIVLAYSVAVLAVGSRPARRGWLTAWAVLAPLSVLMVIPDWFLSDVLGTLAFPVTGGPFVASVPVAMAGMWTMALMPLVLLGAWAERVGGPAAAATAVGSAGLALFWAAERLAPVVPLWEPVDVALLGGAAAYVLPAEVVLAVAAWLLVRGAGVRGAMWTAAGVVSLPFLYLGLVAFGYQVLG